jgi:hypothetical protein
VWYVLKFDRERLCGEADLRSFSSGCAAAADQLERHCSSTVSGLAGGRPDHRSTHPMFV